MGPLRIGQWEFDPSDGTLRSHAGSTRLEPKVQAVLELLAKHHGTVVSQQQLMRDVWPGTHVAPGALARTISVLRTALGDDAREPRYVQTVPKRGYRLIARVTDHQHPPSPSPPASVTVHVPPGRRILPRLALFASALLLTSWPAHRGAPRVPAIHFDHNTPVENERAFDHYAHAARLRPDSADAHAGLAMAAAFRANYMPDRDEWVDAATASARRALDIDRANVMALRALAIADVQGGRLREAAGHFRRLLDRHPADGVAASNLGRILLWTGDVSLALAQFERQIQLDPHSADTYASFAQGFAIAAIESAAVASSEAALAIDPFNVSAHLTLARLALTNGRYDDARQRLTRVLHLRPDCVQCIVQLGIVEQMQGRLGVAAEQFRAARTLSPGHAAASLRLAQVLTDSGDRGEAAMLLRDAEAAARDALRRKTDSPHPLWQLAGAASVAGDRQRALERYREAVAAGRHDPAWDRWDPLFTSLRAEAEFNRLLDASERYHRAAAPIAARLPSLLSETARHRAYRP